MDSKSAIGTIKLSVYRCRRLSNSEDYLPDNRATRARRETYWRLGSDVTSFMKQYGVEPYEIGDETPYVIFKFLYRTMDSE